MRRTPKPLFLCTPANSTMPSAGALTGVLIAAFKSTPLWNSFLFNIGCVLQPNFSVIVLLGTGDPFGISWSIKLLSAASGWISSTLVIKLTSFVGFMPKSSSILWIFSFTDANSNDLALIFSKSSLFLLWRVSFLFSNKRVSSCNKSTFFDR